MLPWYKKWHLDVTKKCKKDLLIPWTASWLAYPVGTLIQANSMPVPWTSRKDKGFSLKEC